MLSSPSCLKDITRRLQKIKTKKPAWFEYIVADAFRQIFYLPLYTADTDNSRVPHRVVWNGSIDKKRKAISKSPSGPDSICHACGFHILIESTLRSGANQWRKEYVESIRHRSKFVRDKGLDKKDVYVILVTPKLHKETYEGFKPKVMSGDNFILLETPVLAKIFETCKLALTVKHLDLCMLFKDLVEELRKSESFSNFLSGTNEHLLKWQKDILGEEKTVFFGFTSYKTIRTIGGSLVAMSQILTKLQRDRRFKRYTRIIDVGDPQTCIKNGLLAEKLAHLIRTPVKEEFFCPVHVADFKLRLLKLTDTMEKIG